MIRRILTAVAVAALTLGGAATAASAASGGPATFTASTGASVTLDHTSYAPGETIAITGAGFLGTDGKGGVQAAIKPDDTDAHWAYGGADAVVPGAKGGLVTFQSHDDGTFAGTVTLPADIAMREPTAIDRASS